MINDFLYNNLNIFGGLTAQKIAVDNIFVSDLTAKKIAVDNIFVSDYDFVEKTNELYTNVNENSSINWNYQGTDIKSLSSNWESTYTILRSFSAFWGGGEDFIQYLNWDDVNDSLELTTGNIVSLSSIYNNSKSYSHLNFLPLSSKTITESNDVYTSVNLTSSNWNDVYTSVNLTSSNWNDVYTDYSTNSSSYATISFSDNKFLPLSGGIIETNSSTDSFKINQSGTGNSFFVENSLNPNSNPVVIDQYGNLGIGTTSPNQTLTVVGNISAIGNVYIGTAVLENATVQKFVNPVTATGDFLIININGSNKAIRLWDFTN